MASELNKKYPKKSKAETNCKKKNVAEVMEQYSSKKHRVEKSDIDKAKAMVALLNPETRLSNNTGWMSVCFAAKNICMGGDDLWEDLQR